MAVVVVDLNLGFNWGWKLSEGGVWSWNKVEAAIVCKN